MSNAINRVQNKRRFSNWVSFAWIRSWPAGSLLQSRLTAPIIKAKRTKICHAPGRKSNWAYRQSSSSATITATIYPRSSEITSQPNVCSRGQRSPSESSLWEAATGRGDEEHLARPRRSRRFLGQRGTMDSLQTHTAGGNWTSVNMAMKLKRASPNSGFYLLQRPQTVRGSWVKHTSLGKHSVSTFNLFPFSSCLQHWYQAKTDFLWNACLAVLMEKFDALSSKKN